MNSLSGVAELHEAVAALCERLNEQRLYFRKMEESPLLKHLFVGKSQGFGIDRDRVVAALANKAANTHRAIRVLCDAGLADDAYALCRVLMENFAHLAWIWAGDWISRIDRYGLFIAPSRRRLMTVIAEHFQGSSVSSQADAAWDKVGVFGMISEELFKDSHLRWAKFDSPKRKNESDLKAMMRELDPQHVAPMSGHFAYALTYFDCSQFVHSNMLSLRYLDSEVAKEQCYTIRERQRSELVELSLILSVTWMLAILGALNGFLRACLDAEIDVLVARLKEYRGAVDIETALHVTEKE